MFIQHLSDDCRILLERALLGKEIACFGIDGFGQYGHSDQAQTYKVRTIAIDLIDDGDHDIPHALAWIFLDGYDSDQFGHIVTDQNFKFSVDNLLQSNQIRKDCWSWGPFHLQEKHAVLLKISVDKLLEWV